MGGYHRQCPQCQRAFTHPPAFTVHHKSCGNEGAAASPATPRRVPPVSHGCAPPVQNPGPLSTSFPWRLGPPEKTAKPPPATERQRKLAEQQQAANDRDRPHSVVKPEAAISKPPPRAKRAAAARKTAIAKLWTDSPGGDIPRRATPLWNVLLSVGAIGKQIAGLEERTPANRKSSDWPNRRGEWRRRLLCELPPAPAPPADTARLVLSSSTAAAGWLAATTDPVLKLTVKDLVDSVLELEVALLFSATLPTWTLNRENWQERVLRCVRTQAARTDSRHKF